MNFITTPTIQFEYQKHKFVPIKDIVALETYSNTIIINLKDGDLIDEIASRKEIYGEGAENQSYKIFEANIATIVDNKFDLSLIKSLQVPQA